METRITRLEEFADDAKQRLARIEMQLANINLRLDGMATKADLAVLTARMDSVEARTHARMDAMDARMGAMDARMNDFATKADLAKAEKRIIMWVATTFVLTQLLPSLIDRLSAL